MPARKHRHDPFGSASGAHAGERRKAAEIRRLTQPGQRSSRREAWVPSLDCLTPGERCYIEGSPGRRDRKEAIMNRTIMRTGGLAAFMLLVLSCAGGCQRIYYDTMEK